MNEPTIDEPLTIDDMLGWLGQMAMDGNGNDCGAIDAIAAILEQHREIDEQQANANLKGTADLIRRHNLKIIRAFVERVEHDWRSDGDVDWMYRKYVMAELAAVEKEAEDDRK